MEQSESSFVYFATAVAALIGAGLGGFLGPCLWFGLRPISLNDSALVSAGGVLAGSIPGWIAGLLCKVAMDKFSCNGKRWILSALVSSSVAFVIAGLAVTWFLIELAHGLGGIGHS